MHRLTPLVLSISVMLVAMSSALAAEPARPVAPATEPAAKASPSAKTSPAARAAATKATIAATNPAPAASAAQDQAELDRTQIIGNRELPKVLYIVPWKRPIPGDLSGRPPVSVLDEALAPVDREVFKRQINYDAQAQARVAPAATPAAPAPAK